MVVDVVCKVQFLYTVPVCCVRTEAVYEDRKTYIPISPLLSILPMMFTAIGTLLRRQPPLLKVRGAAFAPKYHTTTPRKPHAFSSRTTSFSSTSKSSKPRSPDGDNTASSSFDSAMDFSTSLFQFAAIVYCVQTYVLDVTMCVGPSMLPTLNSAGDIILLSRFLHRYRPVEINDVVLAKSPNNPKQIVCKRVVGLPGDHIQYKRPRCGNMEFSYSKQGIVVPDGHIWLQGDNESNSTDSRHYGPIPEALVTGIVCLRIWPLFQVGTLKNKTVGTTRTERKQYEHDQRMEKRKKVAAKKAKEAEAKEIQEAKEVQEAKEIQETNATKETKDTKDSSHIVEV